MGRSCSIHIILMLSQLQWAGHVARMPDNRLSKTFFYSELQQGKCSHGGNKKRFRDTLKTSLKAFNINPDTWEQTAVDRAGWRYSIHRGAILCGERRTATTQQKRQARNAHASKLRQVSHIAFQAVTAHSVHASAWSATYVSTNHLTPTPPPFNH